MKKISSLLIALLLTLTLILSACAESSPTTTPHPSETPTAGGNQSMPGQQNGNPPTPGNNQSMPGQQNSNPYSLEQAMSDEAQLSTIAFSGLAFITGNAGADTFFPPGKVADFFGFQYMRDVDTAGYGHNTLFLSRVANNVLYILNDTQKARLIALAKEQTPLYVNFAYNRFLLTNAFRRNLEANIPAGATGLGVQAVSQYTSGLYSTDADLSYNRALIVGGIINSFTADQKAYLAAMQFNNYSSWPDVAEDQTLKRSLNNNEFVAVMTYASELFSWYKGSLDADVYFCPERHGTYFGGFYMKDYPAMGNPDYFISTNITGDKGKEFLKILNTEQRALITGIIDEQRSALAEIAEIRTAVCTELRKAITGGTIDKEKVYSLIERYGELDGQMSALYATRFSEVDETLTETQRTGLIKLRNLDVVPQGAYCFSTPVAMPEIPNTDFMFGVGNVPENAGQLVPPDGFNQ
jgi:Spy/CpxP family protein refolding chaperone